MRKPARLLTLLLAFTTALLPLCAARGESVTLATPDYTVAEKFQRQLDAGTGFSGTLTLESVANGGAEGAFVTASPLVLGLKYIQIRANALQSVLAERRLDVSLLEGDTAASTLSVALRDGRAFLAGDVLGEGWYQLSGGVEVAAAQSVGATLQSGAAPGIYQFLLPLLLLPPQGENADLAETLETYSTKVDLWLEGYRQVAALGKLEDGRTTMEVSYQVPPAAIKAQLKQLLLDALADPVLLQRLRAWLPDDDAARYLDPELQSYYFSAIDALPLNGDFTLTRVGSLKGGTLKLDIALPLYDAQAGAITLRYSRVAPLGDEPGSQSFRLEGQSLTLALECTEYETMTGATVYQGTLLRLPHGEAANAEEPSLAEQIISCGFTLTYTAENETTADNKERESHTVKLTLAPDAIALQDIDLPENAVLFDFTPFELNASLTFASGRAQNTSTSLDLVVTLGGDEQPQTLTLTLAGKTVAPWAPTTINELNAADLGQMTESELSEWLLGAGLKGALLIAPHFQTAAPAETPAASPTAASTDTPTASPTEAPAEQPTAEPAAEPAATEPTVEP